MLPSYVHMRPFPYPKDFHEAHNFGDRQEQWLCEYLGINMQTFIAFAVKSYSKCVKQFVETEDAGYGLPVQTFDRNYSKAELIEIHKFAKKWLKKCDEKTIEKGFTGIYGETYEDFVCGAITMLVNDYRFALFPEERKVHRQMIEKAIRESEDGKTKTLEEFIDEMAEKFDLDFDSEDEEPQGMKP